jgi:hypothetical protein
MFGKRLFLILLITATMASITSAQSKRGWGNKSAQQEAKTQTASSNTGNQNAEPGDRNGLEGTWRATETFDPQSIFRVLFTFSAGREDNNGTVIHSDELFLTGGPSCLPGQGVWKRAGERKFIATDEGFCFDPFATPIFAPAGKIKFKSAITLNNQGTEFNGTMHIDGFDVDGNIVFTADAALHGTRMRAEAP